MKKTLTIAIPVYNGGLTIGETLDSILSQNKPGVEIIISDNASTDQTCIIIRKYQEKFPEIKYFKNNENIGADANIDLAVRRSTGDYVWILGDDDEIVDGGVLKVLEVINSNIDLAAVFVNYSLHDRITGEICEERVLKVYSDVNCANSDIFLNVVTIFPNFLSSNIVNRSLWINIDGAKYIGTHWLQFGMLMSIIPGHCAFCIAYPYVMNKGIEYNGPNEANKNGVAVGILMNLLDIVTSLPLKFYSIDSISKTRADGYRFLPRKITSSRKNGMQLSHDLFHRLNYHFGNRVTFWLRDVPILLLPQKIHLWIWKIYKQPAINKVYWKIISVLKWN